MPNGLITDLGKRATAYIYGAAVTHGAFGRPAWPDLFNPPAERFTADALLDEFGRAPVRAVRYLMEDPAGTVYYRQPDGAIEGPYRYATAAEEALSAAQFPPVAPSSFIEFEFAIPANAAIGEVVGEIALVMGSVTSAPEWATPAQVLEPGVPVYLITVPAKSIEANEEIVRRVAIRV